CLAGCTTCTGRFRPFFLPTAAAPFVDYARSAYPARRLRHGPGHHLQTNRYFRRIPICYLQCVRWVAGGAELAAEPPFFRLNGPWIAPRSGQRLTGRRSAVAFHRRYSRHDGNRARGVALATRRSVRELAGQHPMVWASPGPRPTHDDYRRPRNI